MQTGPVVLTQHGKDAAVIMTSEYSWELHINRRITEVVYLLPKDIAQPIRNMISSLKENPYPAGRRLIGGFDDVYQVTVAHHDILFQVLEEPLKIVQVLKVQLRSG